MEDNKRLRTRVELIEENHGDLDDITQQVSQKLQQSGVDSQQIQGIFYDPSGMTGGTLCFQVVRLSVRPYR